MLVAAQSPGRWITDIESRELLVSVLVWVEEGSANLSPEGMAAKFGSASHRLHDAIQRLESWRLAYIDGDRPVLTRAGAQFLERHGMVTQDCLRFAVCVDDLDAREALRQAGQLLVGELHAASVDGQLVECVRDLVPPAFEPVVDASFAALFYAAAAALVARVAANAMVACVAEEILVVRLLELAQGALEDQLGSTGDRFNEANDALEDLFDLCGDKDILFLFGMKEPGDAAVAEHSTLNNVMGIVDQRPGAWFTPFGWSVASGHLDDRPVVVDDE